MCEEENSVILWLNLEESNLVTFFLSANDPSMKSSKRYKAKIRAREINLKLEKDIKRKLRLN